MNKNLKHRLELKNKIYNTLTKNKILCIGFKKNTYELYDDTYVGINMYNKKTNKYETIGLTKDNIIKFMLHIGRNDVLNIISEEGLQVLFMKYLMDAALYKILLHHKHEYRIDDNIEDSIISLKGAYR